MNSQRTNRIKALVDHRGFTTTIMILIILNSILVGLETYPSIYNKYHELLQKLDTILLWLFTIEIALRIYADRLAFFKSGWGWFDFLIVSSGHIFVGGQFVTILRILRVLRVLRSTSIVPSLRKIVDALLLTIPQIGSILLLMSIIFYIFAVIGTMLYSEISPEYFGNLQLSLLTLFQVVTLEAWASDVMRPIFAESPWSWVYFISFVLVGTFIVFNLFVGVIVNNIEKASTGGDELDDTLNEIAGLRKEIAELKQLIEKNQVAATKEEENIL